MFKLDPKSKFFLFKTNPRFCTVPWSLLYIDSDGSVRTCVMGREIIGNLHSDSIDTILKSPRRLSIKQDILQAHLAENCVGCSKLENQCDGHNDYTFLRNNYNELCRDIDIDYTDVNEFVLGALDLHWSSVCDLKCVTCWAKQSSSLAKEQGVPVRHLPPDKAHALIDWVIDNQTSLREIYLSGGEPMLNKYNEILLTKLQKRPDLQLRINSNLMWSQDNRVLSKVLEYPNILFTASADNIGKKFNYIRRGADWRTFENNLRFLSQVPAVRLRINLVFFVLSALDFVDTIDYFADNFGITDITINQCGMGQTHLRARNLVEAQKQSCISKIHSALPRYEHNLNLVGQLRNCLEELNQARDQSYHEYFDGIDKLANTNWRVLFPDL